MVAQIDAADRVEIYALIDPRDGAIRYIGKANNSVRRLAGHLRDARRRKTPVYNWINKLRTLNLFPTLTILEAVTVSEWPAAERRLIAEYRTRGERLLNVAQGGDEPFCPIETRRANGRLLAGRMNGSIPYPPEKLTRHSIVFDAYEFVLKHRIKRGQFEKAEELRQKMRERFSQEPDLYPKWASV